MDQVNTKKKSKILLVTLGLNSKNKEIRKLGAKKLSQIFKNFGRLRTIIIFSKSVLLKAFVEFESTSSSIKAKNFFHD